MELFIFSRFHVRSGNQSSAEEALHVLGKSPLRSQGIQTDPKP